MMPKGERERLDHLCDMMDLMVAGHADVLVKFDEVIAAIEALPHRPNSGPPGRPRATGRGRHLRR